MQVTIIEDIQLIDGDDAQKGRVPLAPGEYELERIANPYGYGHLPWLTLKGTRLGLTEVAWRDHQKRGHVQLSEAGIARQSVF